MSNGAREQNSQFLSEIKESFDKQDYERKFSSFSEAGLANGIFTKKWLDQYKLPEMVDKHKIITREQYQAIMESRAMQTYIHLREKFIKKGVKTAQKMMYSLYTQIDSILKNKELSDSEKRKGIREALLKANLCSYFPGSKDPDERKSQLLGYAADLGLSVNETSSRESVCYALLGALVVTEKNSAFLKQLEKMFFNPNKKGLPDKLSRLTPGQIAATIKRYVRKISGPVFGALLEPKETFETTMRLQYERPAPVFMLLGDYHKGRQQCESCSVSDECYSLYTSNPTFLKFLSEQVKSSNWSIDLFLEDWTRTQYMGSNSFFKNRIYQADQDSALIEIEDLTTPCVGQRKENSLRKSCFFTEFRTHSANPRSDDLYLQWKGVLKNKYIGDTILTWLMQYEPEKLKDEFENRFPGEQIDDLMRELVSLYSARNSIDTLKLFFESPFFNKYSRTLHEFNKLPLEIKKTLKLRLYAAAKIDTMSQYMMSYDAQVRFSMNSLLSMYVDKVSFTPALKKMFINTIKTAQNIFNVSLGSHLVDIYTISRSLKGFDDGLPSQLSVVYQGNSHIKRQILLLQDYYNVKWTWGRENISTYQNLSKCIPCNPRLSESFLTKQTIEGKTKVVLLFDLYNFGKEITVEQAISLTYNPEGYMWLREVFQLIIPEPSLFTEQGVFFVDRYPAIECLIPTPDIIQRLFERTKIFNKIVPLEKQTTRFGNIKHVHLL
jgi:hypothetical protein